MSASSLRYALTRFRRSKIITPRYIVGSARGTINRLQRSFFFFFPSELKARLSSRGRRQKEREERERENFRKTVQIGRTSIPRPHFPRLDRFLVVAAKEGEINSRKREHSSRVSKQKKARHEYSAGRTRMKFLTRPTVY